MKPIDTDDGLFHDGNPYTGALGTPMPAWWVNQIQAELLAVIAASGLSPSSADNAQLLLALRNLFAEPSDLSGFALKSDLSGLALKSDLNGLALKSDLSGLALKSDLNGLATQTDLANLLAPGEVSFFARESAPNGWLKANGAAVSRTTYANLFAAIGTTFGGGDGSTTFTLPDLRGEFVRGWDDGRWVDAGRAMGSWQGGEIQSHTHDMTLTAYSYNALTSNHGWGGDDSPHGPYTNTTSAAGGAETRPRNLALLACIKY